MTTNKIPNPNRLLKKGGDLLSLLDSDSLEKDLQELDIDWNNKGINSEALLYPMLKNNGYVKALKNRASLTRLGELFLSRLCIDFESEFKKHKVVDKKYRIILPISIGKNSATFKVEHEALGSVNVLKFLRPGAAENLRESLKIIGGFDERSGIISPRDVFQTEIRDIFGAKVVVDCVVFPFVEGETLREFLSEQGQPLSSSFVLAFVKQIGGILEKLEQRQAYHGDFHDENIFVDTISTGGLKFYVIDVSFGMIGSKSSEDSKNNDMSQFKNHILCILRQQQSYLKSMSVKKYLGASNYFFIEEILRVKELSYKKVLDLVVQNPKYKKYIEEKREFIAKKFKTPGGLKLLRYEEIISPEIAVQLFEPYPNIMNDVEQFCCGMISGHRGSGKSTYIASLAFFPSVSEPSVNPSEIFGIYFPCRQGEFKLFSSNALNYDARQYQWVKHIFIIKIIRRTLESLSDSIDLKRFVSPQGCDSLVTYLSKFSESRIVSYTSDVSSDIQNLLAVIIRIEMKEIDRLFDTVEKGSAKFKANERNLMQFFEILQDTFEELALARFYILFDDAGQPNVPSEAQMVINDLIMASNPIYCIKLSAEKYTYLFSTTEGKNLELDQDYFETDISKTLFIGGKNKGADPKDLEKYFRSIVEKRLLERRYRSANIRDYLGNELMPLDQLATILADRPTSAFYFGWNIVWQTADRTPRSLLEIVSEILGRADIDQDSPAKVVHKRTQDRAIRNISEKRLRALTQISGGIEIDGNLVSLGVRLAQVTSCIGTTFRTYLVQSKGKQRKDQLLAIERNDSEELNETSTRILEKLISYGILDDSRVEAARDDGVVKPIYVLNRIYCPAFRIGLQRDQHLRLSKLKFEELFLDPKRFRTDGTRRLSQGQPIEPPISDLFEGI